MKLYSLIILLLLINIINCQNNCEPDYEFQDINCNGIQNIISKPKYIIYNYNIYDSISVTPTPFFQGYVSSSQKYEIHLDISNSYTLTFKTPTCSYEIKKSINDTFQLVIQQPKCSHSYGIIDLPKLSNKQVKVSGKDVTLPYEMTFEDSIANNMDFNYVHVEGCSILFLLNQGPKNGPLAPKFSLSHSTCGLGGKIYIENFAEYNSITITNSNNNPITDSRDDGLFSNIEPGSYSIVLESNQCGKQLFNIEIKDFKPIYQIVLLNDSCPTKPEYQVILDGEYNYELVYNGSVIDNPFIYDGEETDIQVEIENCGSITIPIDIIESIPPIHYTIAPLSSNDFNFCDGRYIVTLLYDSNFLQDIKITNQDSFGNSKDIEVINNTFVVHGSHNSYTIHSECYSKPIYIVAPSRKPHYTILNQEEYCNKMVDISIDNYLDYNEMQLVSQSGITYLPEDGIFRQVPNQVYKLKYIYRNCSETYESINIGKQYEPKVYFSTRTIQEPDCEETGIVELIFYDAYTNKEFMKYNQTIYSYQNSQPYYFYVPVTSDIYCLGIPGSFNFTKNQPDFTITTLSTPTCLQSSEEVLVEIKSEYIISGFTINGQSYTEEVNKFYIKSGENIITVKFYSYLCGEITKIYFPPALYPDYKVLYDTIPVDDCSKSDGGFLIRNYLDFNKLIVNGNINLLANHGELKGIASNYYTLDYEIQLGNASQICSGSEEIYVPTILPVNIDYNFIKQPICNSSYGVAAIQSIKDKNGNSYLEDASPVENIRVEINGSTIMIQSGTCSWLKSFTLAYQEQNLNYPVFEVAEIYTQNCITYTRFRINFNNSFTLMNSEVPIGFSINSSIYTTLSSYESDQDLYIYVDGCKYYYYLYSYPEKFQDIKYTIQFNGDPSCLSSYTSINISVADYQNYSSLTYNGIPIGSNGVFSNVRPGYYIYGTLLNAGCKLNTQVLVDKPFVSNSKTVVNETCYSSLNGELSINQDSNDSDYYYLLQNNGDYYTDEYSSYYPVSSDQDLSSFTLLGSQDLRIIKVNKLHPTCLAYEEFTMNANEPEIITTISTECENGTIYSSLINSNLSGYYSLINYTLDNSTPSQTILPQLLVISNSSSSSLPSSSSSEYILETTARYTNLTSGNYTIIFEIKNDICRRKLVSPISVQLNCNKDNSNSDNDSSNNDKLGLKIGLPIGLFFLAAFVGIGIYLYIKKLQKSKSKAVKMTQF